MSKIVIYKSKYGATKKYASWIAKALGADIASQKEVTIDKLRQYDTIIYGGGLYASGINGISLITKHFDILKEKHIIVFTVGLSDPTIQEHFKAVIDENFTEKMQTYIKVYHLRGGIDYSQLSWVHKVMMRMLKSLLSKKEKSELTQEDKQLLKTYGQRVDFTNIKTIRPLVEYVKSLG